MDILIPLIAFIVLGLASLFLIIRKGLSGKVKAFLIISVILCIGVLVYIFWGSTSYDVAIMAMILFIPAIILAPVLLIALIILFISALTSSSEEKDKETEVYDFNETYNQAEELSEKTCPNCGRVANPTDIICICGYRLPSSQPLKIVGEKRSPPPKDVEEKDRQIERKIGEGK